MTDAESKARELGWFPTFKAHVVFKRSLGVCRHLRPGETYNEETDSYVSAPLRHADSWEAALEMDARK